MQTENLKVYWRPGCSSCVRVKEFLTKLGVEYESVNVSARPEAMNELLELGVRTVPVVSRGREYVFAQELADVSKFLGKSVAFERLPAAILMERWLNVLRAAQRHARQIPAGKLERRATEGRDRSIRDLACHVYQVPEAFLKLVEEGFEHLPTIYNAPPPASVKTPADIAGFGASITSRVERWWAGVADKSCAGTVKTYYGVQPLHHVLERSTWHSAQHARQIQVVLEELGVRPEGPLTEKDYAGLPLPAGLWE
jgi:glutaredoxin